MKKYAVLFLVVLSISHSLNSAVDAYSFYVYGFQGAEKNDSAMKNLLAAAWDQLPEVTSQQKDLKSRLAEKYQNKFDAQVNVAIEQLPRLAQLSQACGRAKTELETSWVECQKVYNTCRSDLVSQKQHSEQHLKNFEDVKTVKEEIEKRVDALKIAEDLCRKFEDEEQAILAEYQRLLEDSKGQDRIQNVIALMNTAYTNYDNAIKQLEQSCRALNVTTDVKVTQEHLIVGGLIELYRDQE